MQLTTFFLRNPVAAIVLNAMIVVVGLMSFGSLSIRQYPQLQVPSVMVTTSYPSASAALVESAVTPVLEDRLGGIEGLENMTSQSSAGTSKITLNFRPDTPIDRAMAAMRDAIELAREDLPVEIKEPIIERKTGLSWMPFVVVSLSTSSLNQGELAHYVSLNIRNALRSLKGVAATEIWGEIYTTKVTLDPHKLFIFGVNADEIFEALRGNLRSLPAGNFQDTIPTTLKAELKDPADFGNLLVKSQDFSGTYGYKQYPVLLKDVAEIVLSTDDRESRVRINGGLGLCVAVNRAQDANPLEVSARVKEKVEQLKMTLPSGVSMRILTDQAHFMRAALSHVGRTILEALLFVIAIVFLFLRSGKATLTPLVAIPISLIGSCLFLKILGGSINILTLMAMVLAVGLVVDDAIVVVENIQRYIEKGRSAFQAAEEGSREIGFAIIAMTLTLISVYIPLCFIEGLVGQLFGEFAIALAGSVLISGVVALTLSPLMCSKTLVLQDKRLWPQVDRALKELRIVYTQALTQLILKKKTIFCIALSAFLLMIGFMIVLPRDLAPLEDRALAGVGVDPLPGQTIDTFEEQAKSIEKRVAVIPEITEKISFLGKWGASIYLPLVPREKRERSAIEIMGQINDILKQEPSLNFHTWTWDTGFVTGDDGYDGDIHLVISTTDSYHQLYQYAELARKALKESNLFASVWHDLTLDALAYTIEPDIYEMMKLNLTPRQIAKTVEVFSSGDRSLRFTKDGILYPLILKGQYMPWGLEELYVTNLKGKRISLAAVSKIVSEPQATILSHADQKRAVVLQANLLPGDKMDAGMEKMLKIVEKVVPATYAKSWSGGAKEFGKTQGALLLLFVMALVFIYAILAVQFESFIDPWIILFTVPLACSGALATLWVFGQSLNIYSQIGLVTLIGLITKHGILIVEFANQLQKQGHSLKDAIVEAASLRLRPILMTTGAMVLGAVPLLLSHEAGFEARRAMGFVFVGGLSLGTLFTLFVLPSVYFFVKKRCQRGEEK